MRPVNVEAALVAHLRSALSVQVGTRVPATRPAKFVVLSRAGGEVSNLVQSSPRMLVECWGATDSEAWALARDTWAAVADTDGRALTQGVWVARVELTEPVNYPDDATASPRYQFIATLTVNLEETP